MRNGLDHYFPTGATTKRIKEILNLCPQAANLRNRERFARAQFRLVEKKANWGQWNFTEAHPNALGVTLDPSAEPPRQLGPEA